MPITKDEIVSANIMSLQDDMQKMKAGQIDWRKVAESLRDQEKLAESAMRHFPGDPSLAGASMVFRGLAAAIEDGLS